MTNHMTEEQLDALERDVRDKYDAGIASVATAPVLELITALRQERAAHQATQAVADELFEAEVAYWTAPIDSAAQRVERAWMAYGDLRNTARAGRGEDAS